MATQGALCSLHQTHGIGETGSKNYTILTYRSGVFTCPADPKILDVKRANPLTDVAALEAEIDRLVYALYGLTEEEIVVVEGK